MAATKGQINWTGIGWNSLTFTRITGCNVDQGGQLIRFKGDTDIYTSIIANVNNEPSVSVTSGDPASLHGIATGVSATWTGTLKDARGATGGDIIFVMINAVFETVTTNAQHAQFASATASWQGYSADGVTNPLTFTRA
jgi:hypothetical protein